MLDLSFDRRAARDGIITITPLAAPGIPFGIVIGLLVQEEGLSRLAGWSSSWIIFAGSSQLAGLSLLAEGAGAAFVILSIFLINSRHIVYSAALRQTFSVYPRWFRLIGPYFLIDQIFAIATTSPDLDDATPRYRMWHYLASGLWMWSIWQLSVGAGVLAGNVIREEWRLGFAAPVVFLGLMVLSIKNSPGVIAAVVAAIVAVVARDLPSGSGLVLGIVTGMFSGVLAESLMGTSEDSSDGNPERATT